ncbi:MAG: hypothetical protein KDA63_13330 [Planctomycetales bacterium]|nr:hypothetical protein [Planctomycetales bacterium]
MPLPLRIHRESIRRHAPLLAVLGVALLLRVAVVVILAGAATQPGTYEHGEIAKNLLAGRGFSVWFLGSEGPTSQQAPLYPLLLAGAYWMFGVDSTAALLAVQLLQCIAGVVTVYALMRLAWALLPEARALGWVAGVALAVHPAHLYAVAHIQVVTWATMLLTMLLAVTAEPHVTSPVGRRAAIAGLLAGLMLLVEPILALAIPFAAWMLFRSYFQSPLVLPLRHRLSGVAAMAVVCAAVLTPWLVRNWWVHGEPVFVKSTFGYAFWQGNNPSSYGTDKIPKPSVETLRRAHDATLTSTHQALNEARHETVYIDDLTLRPGGYVGLIGLSEPERSRVLARRAWHFITSHPADYGRLCLARLRYFFLFDETNPKAAHWVYRATTVVWLITLVVGLWGWRGWWRPLWPLFGILVAVATFHVLTITSARFRMPLEPFSLIWCAGAVVPAIKRVFDRLTSATPLRVVRPADVDDQQTDSDAAILPGPFTDEQRPPARKAS